MFNAINWLAPAKTTAENKKLSVRLIPHPLDNIPNATAAGTYPIKIGIFQTNRQHKTVPFS
jgi:hypothetical protein